MKDRRKAKILLPKQEQRTFDSTEGRQSHSIRADKKHTEKMAEDGSVDDENSRERGSAEDDVNSGEEGGSSDEDDERWNEEDDYSFTSWYEAVDRVRNAIESNDLVLVKECFDVEGSEIVFE